MAMTPKQISTVGFYTLVTLVNGVLCTVSFNTATKEPVPFEEPANLKIATATCIGEQAGWQIINRLENKTADYSVVVNPADIDQCLEVAKDSHVSSEQSNKLGAGLVALFTGVATIAGAISLITGMRPPKKKQGASDAAPAPIAQ